MTDDYLYDYMINGNYKELKRLRNNKQKGDKVMAKIEVIRGLIRPFISVVFVSTVCYLSLKGKIDASDILQLTGMIVAFHFGERSAAKKEEKPKP